MTAPTDIGPRERVTAALAGEIADRPPLTLWRHWPVDDQDAATHARVAVAHHRHLDLDILKLTPSAAFMSEAWGAVTEYRGAPTGVRDYVTRPISRPADWDAVTRVDPHIAPSLAREVEVVRRVRADLGSRTPLLATVFTPLSVVRYLAGDGVFTSHLRREPEAVARALRAIADTTSDLVRLLLEAGADGIYFSLFPASYAVMSEVEYRELVLPFDRVVMEAAEDAWLRVAHFHLPDPMLAVASALPVNLVSWEHTHGGPDLGDGAAIAGHAVIGGVDQIGALGRADAATVRAEGRRLVRTARLMRPAGLIAATSCSYPLITPEGNLLALRDGVFADSL